MLQTEANKLTDFGAIRRKGAEGLKRSRGQLGTFGGVLFHGVLGCTAEAGVELFSRGPKH